MVKLKVSPGSILFKGQSGKKDSVQKGREENRSIEENIMTKQSIFLTEYSVLQ